MPRLADKVCLLTGAPEALVSRQQAGSLPKARVMLIDLRAEDLAKAAAKLGADRIQTVVADVSRLAEVAEAVGAIVRHWGRIDFLFSNAGNFGVVAPIAAYPEDMFEAVLAMHVKGASLMRKHATPQMNDGGSVIIASSVAGVRGDSGVYGYITAKHAQVSLMRCLAKELAPRRIRINTIHPGPIANGFQDAVEANLGKPIARDGAAFFDDTIQLGRHATPNEVAQSVLYLASDESRFTTGSRLIVGDGMSA